MHTNGSYDSRVVFMGQGLMLSKLSNTAEDTQSLYPDAVYGMSAWQIIEKIVELAIHIAHMTTDFGIRYFTAVHQHLIIVCDIKR